ncbi:MAG: aspartyl/asparaginyl beta-hydroxylase domain-containing protein [Pseudomonadales bacterium]
MELRKPFIRLPFNFDADRLSVEMEQLEPSAWMAHPSGLKGNSAIALISRDGQDNNDFIGNMKPTPHLASCSYHQQVMGSFGEVLTRSRLMKLDAGCEVTSHVDFNYHWYSRVRMHIPVVTNPDVMFYCGDEQVHMQAGECWIFDNWRRHNVINGGQEDRVHLVVDLAGSSRFWQMARRMEQYDVGDNVSELIQFVPYDAHHLTEILTENYNSAPVMAPGEIDGLVSDLIRDFERHPGNDAALVDRYRLLLMDFASDWREIWLQYGIQQSGIRQYQALIERTVKQLHPDRRALVTASNDIGVNAIIMQRILRAALVTEVREDFIDDAGD